MWWNDVKLNVQPIFVNYSPCVTGEALNSLSKAEVDASMKEKMEKIQSSLKYVNILEPLLVESEEDIQSIKGKLTKDVDFLLPTIAGHLYKDGWRHSLPTELRLGDFDIPVLKLAMSVWDFLGLELVAALRDRGKKAYYAATPEIMNNTLKTQQVKKAMSLSKCLIFGNVQNRLVTIQEGIAGNIYDPILVKEKLGIEIEYWTTDQLAKCIEKHVSLKDAEKIADDWLNGAVSVRHVFRKDEVDRKYIVNLARLHLGMKKALELTKSTALAGCGASAFAISPEAPPCLPFTWLKDEGIPAGCEADMNATLAMIMMQYTADAPVDMGNILQPIGASRMADFDVPDPLNDTTLQITHSVTPRKFKGYCSKAVSYELIGTHCSTCYGTNHYVELEEGCPATVARFSPRAKKLMLCKGIITGSEITPAEGNREVAYIDIGRNAAEFMSELANYGNHLAYVYGDHINKLCELCNELGVEPDILASK